MNQDKLQKNAEKILYECSALQPGESVLIITDHKQEPDLYGCLFEAAVRLGGNPVVCLMNQVMPGGDLPEVVNDAAKAADIILTLTSTSIFHSEGIRRACLPPYNARVIGLSEWQLDTLATGGIEADFPGIAPTVEKVQQYFNEGHHIVLATPGGTRIEADIQGRQAWANTGISDRPGKMNGLPTIEVYIAPLEESVNGVICVDASCSGGIGVIRQPILISVEKGKAVSIEGGQEAAALNGLLQKAATEKAYQIAEIAVGLNPHCRITGLISEDEGKYGTCHIALGNNTVFGGINYAPLHIDMVQWKPTLTIDGKVLFEEGQMV